MASACKKTPVRLFLSKHHPDEVSSNLPSIIVSTEDERPSPNKSKARARIVKGFQIAPNVLQKALGVRPKILNRSPIIPARRKKACQEAGIFPIKPMRNERGTFQCSPYLNRKAANSVNKKCAAKLRSRIPVPVNRIITAVDQKISALEKQEYDLTQELIKTKEELRRLRSTRNQHIQHCGDSRSSKNSSFSPLPGTPISFDHLSPALLPPSKINENSAVALYENYRRTCTYLHTPESSNFKSVSSKYFSPLRSSADVSFNVQKQLADLFNFN